MRILLTGSSGFIGSGLLRHLQGEAHDVVRLVRYAAAPRATELFWNPEVGALDATQLEDFEAVVHLAGDNLAEGRWTEAKKARIRDSRVRSTRLLCDVLARLSRPPKVLASASAVGFYGHRGDAMLTEASGPGSGFLAGVCQAWEEATHRAADKGVRVVLLRFGMVLSQDGGAVAKMLLPFRLGLGGMIGPGTQYWSWITLQDALRALSHTLRMDELAGPVNLVSAEPVTNREFTRELGRALGRRPFLPLPSLAARLVFGPMASETLLASQRAQPERLLSTGFTFRFPRLADAFRSMLA